MRRRIDVAGMLALHRAAWGCMASHCDDAAELFCPHLALLPLLAHPPSCPPTHLPRPPCTDTSWLLRTRSDLRQARRRRLLPGLPCDALPQRLRGVAVLRRVRGREAQRDAAQAGQGVVHRLLGRWCDVHLCRVTSALHARHTAVHVHVNVSVNVSVNVRVRAVVCAGALGGIAYWLFTYPLDVIKSAMQTDALLPADRKYRSYPDAVRKVRRPSVVEVSLKCRGSVVEVSWKCRGSISSHPQHMSPLAVSRLHALCLCVSATRGDVRCGRRAVLPALPRASRRACCERDPRTPSASS
jgi:hypothetical protein